MFIKVNDKIIYKKVNYDLYKTFWFKVCNQEYYTLLLFFQFCCIWMKYCKCINIIWLYFLFINILSCFVQVQSLLYKLVEWRWFDNEVFFYTLDSMYAYCKLYSAGNRLLSLKVTLKIIIDKGITTKLLNCMTTVVLLSIII